MIRMSRAPQEAISGADETLASLYFDFDSGNRCLVTPAMTGQGERARIAIFMKWVRPPSASELAEMRAQLTNMGLLEMEMFFESRKVEEAKQVAEAWLREGEGHGKPPS